MIFHRGYPRSMNSAAKEPRELFIGCGCHNFFIRFPYLDRQMFTSVGTKNTPDSLAVSRCQHDQQSDQLCQAVINWHKLTIWIVLFVWKKSRLIRVTMGCTKTWYLRRESMMDRYQLTVSVTLRTFSNISHLKQVTVFCTY